MCSEHVKNKDFHLIRSFYFGWVKYSGHTFLQRGEMSCPPSSTDKIPWKPKEIDGKLQPDPRDQQEGIACVHRKEGWTAISFWDRSGDKRMNSNTTFIANGVFSFAEMIEIAKEGFPGIWARFTFEVKKAAGDQKIIEIKGCSGCPLFDTHQFNCLFAIADYSGIDISMSGDVSNCPSEAPESCPLNDGDITIRLNRMTHKGKSR